MRIIRAADRDFVPATLPGCTSAFNAAIVAAAQPAGFSMDFMRVAGSGGIPVHVGRRDQIVTLVEGQGRFFGLDIGWVQLLPSDSVIWLAGEERSWHSDDGMTMVSVRAHRLVQRPL